MRPDLEITGVFGDHLAADEKNGILVEVVKALTESNLSCFRCRLKVHEMGENFTLSYFNDADGVVN